MDSNNGAKDMSETKPAWAVELITEVKEMKSQLALNCTKLDNVQTDVKNVQTDVKNVQTDVKNVQTDVKNVQTDLKDVQTKTDNMQSQINDFYGAFGREISKIQVNLGVKPFQPTD